MFHLNPVVAGNCDEMRLQGALGVSTLDALEKYLGGPSRDGEFGDLYCLATMLNVWPLAFSVLSKFGTFHFMLNLFCDPFSLICGCGCIQEA